MRNITITLAFAIVTLFAFSSCQKENLQDNGSLGGVRIITAEFENTATKTTLNENGKTPEWAVGDVLRVLSSSSYQDVTLAAGDITDNKITFTTTLTGTLYAVYPASATTMESCGDGNITFTIPAIQDGTFASANICVAKSTKEDEYNKDNLIFSNATAVLKITTADDVVGVDVTATNSIAGTVSASFDGNEVNLTTSSLDKKKVSVVGTSAPSDKIFYFAVAPVETGSTDINCYKTETKGSENKSTKELQRNIIYSIDLSSLTIDTSSDLTGQRGILNGHEYVIIKAKYDGTNDSYLKWATMNIGATTIKGYGDYFAWGAAEKAYSDYSSYTFTFLSSRPSSYGTGDWDMNQGFWYKNTPYYDDETGVYSKYTGSDSKYVLEPKDDAAHCIWESTWRMPTGGAGGEFDALCKATYWKWDDTDEGYYVYVPNPSADAGKYNGNGTGTEYVKSDALLFFPAAYQGWDCYNYLSWDSDNPEGHYWASTLGVTSEHATLLHFTKGAVAANNGLDRYFGRSIRPVSD